ncbi:CheR family methyltransferase [Derxia lacustris]|uniref:CheR family methyltransferase n=1 Tax=Derxia lacustris TaxID=764842 RepID=UPI000A16F653|nr:protein-glutamate O-methyltransferase CheR [Derxia lacustris]
MQRTDSPPAELSDRAFTAVCELFERHSGIRLPAQKRAHVVARLGKLAAEAGLPSAEAYVARLILDRDPARIARTVDRLTINETYFFREPAHFDWLAEQLDQWPRSAPPNLWSAACASGEEPYSLAMVLAARLGLDAGWRLLATDLSAEMIEATRRGRYPMDRIDGIPPALLRDWCLRGQGPEHGRLAIARPLRERLQLAQANLAQPLPPAVVGAGPFDIVFLRNVLIYFDPPMRRAVVERVAQQLRPGGWLVVGHAESLQGLDLPLQLLRPSLFRRLV